MGVAYVATALGFLLGLWIAASPETHWHRQYGRMIKDARPTDEGLRLIRRSGIALMVFSVLAAAFLAWFQAESERRTREAVDSIDIESLERIMRPPGSPLDRPAARPPGP